MRAFRVSVAKFFVVPWALRARAAGPAFWEMRNNCNCLTSLPVMPKYRLRVKTKRGMAGVTVEEFMRAASWAWSDCRRAWRAAVLGVAVGTVGETKGVDDGLLGCVALEACVPDGAKPVPGT